MSPQLVELVDSVHAFGSAERIAQTGQQMPERGPQRQDDRSFVTRLLFEGQDKLGVCLTSLETEIMNENLQQLDNATLCGI
jgi:hypothetical protein